MASENCPFTVDLCMKIVIFHGHVSLSEGSYMFHGILMVYLNMNGILGYKWDLMV